MNVPARPRSRAGCCAHLAALFGVLLLASIALPALAGGGNALTITALMADLATVQESHARFEETKTLRALSAPIETTGTLYYRRPDHLEKISFPPHAEQLVVDGRTLRLSMPGAAEQTLDLARAPPVAALVEAIRATLAGDLAALQRDYHVGLDGSAADWHLTLVPSDPAVARFLHAARLSGSGHELRAVAFTEANGDTSEMRIRPMP